MKKRTVSSDGMKALLLCAIKFYNEKRCTALVMKSIAVEEQKYENAAAGRDMERDAIEKIDNFEKKLKIIQ